uniref:Uncharacterized protein n=1 Tax=Salvator merianae TaxID=96440 RepID=A0A8D0BGL5_SALMN
LLLTIGLTYTVKTPPPSNVLRERTSLYSEEETKKKRKVLLELDTQSDSSETNDLLNIVSEEEKFKNLFKDYPQTPLLCGTDQAQSTLKTYGISFKLAAMKKMREDGWTAVSRMDRRRKMKEAEKLFA